MFTSLVLCVCSFFMQIGDGEKEQMSWPMLGEDTLRLEEEEEKKEKERAEKEKAEKEQAEKEKLMAEGFQEWTKRDYNNYIRACEKWGRNNVSEICKEVDGKTAEQITAYHEVFWKQIHTLDVH